MRNIKNRKATFVSSLSFKDIHGKVTSVEGKLRGRISYKITGKRGFGYDPIFIPINKKITFGQMPKFRKIKMDHRFLAFQKLKKKIRKQNENAKKPFLPESCIFSFCLNPALVLK